MRQRHIPLLLYQKAQEVQKQITALNNHVHGLDVRLNKDSHKRSKPPSSDGLGKNPTPRSLRPKTGRKQGG